MLHVSQQDGGGVLSPEAAFGTAGAALQLDTNDGAASLHMTAIGTYTNQGNWFDVNVTVTAVTGSAPSANAKTTLRTLREVFP